MSTAAKVPTRERGKLRVAALLDAGATLFAQKGYGATTMTEIAELAGAAIGSLYQFFPTKEALAEAIFSRYAEHAAAALDDFGKHARGLSATQLANRLVDLMLNLHVDRSAAVALNDAIAGIADRHRPLREAMRQQVAAILRSTNSALSEERAVVAAVLIGQIMKAVPALAVEEARDGKPLVKGARKMLAVYIGSVLDAKSRSA